MATAKRAPKAIAESDDIAWTEIGPDGTETDCTGIVWAAAETLAGMSAWWVIPDEGPEALPGTGPVVLVARASRRHRCGRARASASTFGLSADATIWMPSAGRYVDIGEYFRESDPRSRFERAYVPPTRVSARMDSVSQVAHDQFTLLCERADSVQDFTVHADDVAREAERD